MRNQDDAGNYRDGDAAEGSGQELRPGVRDFSLGCNRRCPTLGWGRFAHSALGSLLRGIRLDLPAHPFAGATRLTLRPTSIEIIDFAQIALAGGDFVHAGSLRS